LSSNKQSEGKNASDRIDCEAEGTHNEEESEKQSEVLEVTPLAQIVPVAETRHSLRLKMKEEVHYFKGKPSKGGKLRGNHMLGEESA
jgi:hypothetical protein